MGHLTTHALDTVLGVGATGLRATLVRKGATESVVATAVMDERGRATLTEALEPGVYELCFEVAAYHRAKGVALTDPPFLDVVPIRFGIADASANYHVPLLVSPFSYATYRGS